MRTPIIWAELHAPIFLAGTNLQQKLDPTKRDGLVLEFDEEKRHLYVSYKGAVSRVPEPSILSMVEAGGFAPKGVTHAIPTIVKAQVSSPQGHVHAGPGAGKIK